jgi:hypothetical protein
MGSDRTIRARRPAAWTIVAVVTGVAGIVLANCGGDDGRIAAGPAESSSTAVPEPERTTVTFDTRGDTVDLVDGWYRSTTPMAPELVNPRELLSLGTLPFEMPSARAVCVGNAPPATPIAAMGPDDVFLWLVEWYPTDSRMPSVETSNRRPAHFVVDGNDRSCVEAASPNVRGGSFQFTDLGRVFSLFYVIGNNVTGDRARVVEDVLDSLTFVD